MCSVLRSSFRLDQEVGGMLFNLEGSPRREDLKMRSQHSDRMLGESPLMAQECGQYRMYTEESLDFSTKAVGVTRESRECAV